MQEIKGKREKLKRPIEVREEQKKKLRWKEKKEDR